MDLLAGYGSESGSEGEVETKVPKRRSGLDA